MSVLKDPIGHYRPSSAASRGRGKNGKVNSGRSDRLAGNEGRSVVGPFAGDAPEGVVTPSRQILSNWGGSADQPILFRICSTVRIVWASPGFRPELRRGVQRPVGIGEQSAQNDQVRSPFAILAHVGAVKQSDGGSPHAGFAFHSFGERNLIPGMVGICWRGSLLPEEQIRSTSPRSRTQPVTRTISSTVNPPSTQSAQERRRNSGRSSGHEARTASVFQQKPGTVFKRTAVIVRPVITKRREKTVPQIPVCRVNFEKFKARVVGPASGSGEIGHDLFDHVGVHGCRRIPIGIGLFRRGDRLPSVGVGRG